MRHLINVRRWLGPLPNPLTVSVDAMMPLTSDIEEGQFVFARDTSESKTLYLCCVTSADDVSIGLHAWGSTSKNHFDTAYRPVMILKQLLLFLI